MKKLFAMLLAAITITSLVACSNDGTTNKDSSTILKKELKASDLSINDFAWETSKTYISGDEYYAMSLTNNSKYDLLAADIYYKVKDDVSDSQLNVFDGFMEEHKDWFDEDETKRDISLVGSKIKLTKNGETIKPIEVTIGIGTTCWYNSPDTTQFNLMEPEKLVLGLIKDNVLYVTYYDFIDKSWALDERTVQLNCWSKNEFAQKITKHVCDYYRTTSDLDDEKRIEFTVYGITKDYFKEYVEEMKNIGFTVDADDDYDTYFTAKDES